MTPTTPSTICKHDPAFATAARMMRRRQGRLHRAQAGQGRLHLRRRRRRRRAADAAPAMAGASPNSTAWVRPRFGLQAGLEQAELVFIINSDRALSGIEHGNFKLGAGAGLTVVNLSSRRGRRHHRPWRRHRGVDLGLGRLCRHQLQRLGDQPDKDDELHAHHRPGSPDAARQPGQLGSRASSKPFDISAVGWGRTG